jgi:hypothetical protein
MIKAERITKADKLNWIGICDLLEEIDQQFDSEMGMACIGELPSPGIEDRTQAPSAILRIAAARYCI